MYRLVALRKRGQEEVGEDMGPIEGSCCITGHSNLFFSVFIEIVATWDAIVSDKGCDSSANSFVFPISFTTGHESNDNL